MNNIIRVGSVCRQVILLLLFVTSIWLAHGERACAQGCHDFSWRVCSGFCGGLSIGAGYFGQKGGADIAFTASGQASGSMSKLRQQIDLGGINVGVAAPFRWAGPLSVLVGGHYSAFFVKPSLETMQVVGAAARARSWQASPQNFDVYAALTMNLSPSVIGMAGLKYENFQVNLLNPSFNFGASQAPLDSAALALNTYTPYLGFVVANAARQLGMNVHLGLLGAPLVFGSVDYRETVVGALVVGGATAPGFRVSNNLGYGYYLESFADASVVTRYGTQLGAYAKYYILQASATVRTGEANANIPQVNYACDLQKRSWEIGGRICFFF